MNREEIRSRFRQECPEITDRVIADSVLNSWLLVGDKEVSARTRLIRTTTSWTATADTAAYDLTVRIANFYDIDDYPGGGVVYNNKRLDLTTIAELDDKNSRWRTESSGTPIEFYRRMQNLYLRPAPSTAGTILVDSIQLSDDFDTDSDLPFNNLLYFEPFHYSLVLYLIKKAKSKVGKPEEARNADMEYREYVDWMRKERDRGIMRPIRMKPKNSYVRGYGPYSVRR